MAQINLITSSELVFKVSYTQWSESLLKSHYYFHAPVFSCENLRKDGIQGFKNWVNECEYKNDFSPL